MVLSPYRIDDQIGIPTVGYGSGFSDDFIHYQKLEGKTLNLCLSFGVASEVLS